MMIDVEIDTGDDVVVVLDIDGKSHVNFADANIFLPLSKYMCF